MKLALMSPLWILYICLEKRSQALRGRNLTRDIQVSGAPMVHLTPIG